MSKQDLRKLKVIPFYTFFRAFSTMNKVLFTVVFAALVAVMIVAAHTMTEPTDWVTDIQKIYDQTPQEVVVKDVNAHNRSMELSLNAMGETTFFRAEPILQQPWMPIAFLCMVVLGWAAMLTSFSYFQNTMAYIGAGLFLIFMTLSGISNALIGSEGNFFIEVAIAVIILFPSILFRQGVFKAKYWKRFFLNLFLIGAPFAMVYFTKGWTGSFSQATNLFPFFFLFTVVVIFFLAREPMNLMAYLISNSKNKKFRLPLSVLLSLFLILFSIEFILLHNAMDWDFIPVSDTGLRPLYLLLPTGLFAVFTAQNLYPIAKEFTTSPGFSFLILGSILVAFAGIAFYPGTGDNVFVIHIERITAITFTVGTLLQFLYISLNFFSLIAAKINYYFIMMYPRRVLYVFVVVAMIFSMIGLEASDRWRSRLFFFASQNTLFGDDALNVGNYDEAYAMYKVGAESSIRNVKAYYNMAHLAQAEKQDPSLAVENYEKATREVSFPLADLNRSTILYSLYLKSEAREAMEKSLSRELNPWVANNLALTWFRDEKPDSAITYLKKALALEPEEASLYANLGLVYLMYNRPDWARKMLDAGIQSSKPDPTAVTNALLYNLAQPDAIELDSSFVENGANGEQEAVQLNYALYLYRSGDLVRTRQYLEGLLQKNETADALLLHGIVLMELGEVDFGLSRFQYMANSETYVEYRGIVHRFLGMSYFIQGVPEMAAYEFKKAVESGSKIDYLQWGDMLIDAGRQDSGYAVLRRGRAAVPELVDAVGREESMLLKANGEPLAVIMGGLTDLTKDEYIRISRYAAMAGNYPIALDNFRFMIEEDSSDATPYLEMGRLYLKYANEPLLALENLQYGSKLFPKDTRLKVEIAHAFTRAGQVDRAKTVLEGITAENAAEPFRYQLVSALMKAAEGDSTGAKEILKTLHQQSPLNNEILMALGPLLQNPNDGITGQQIFYEALQRNHLNKDLWLQMAAFEKIVGRPEEAGHAAVNAISLSLSEQEKLSIAGQYAEEIRILKTNDL